MTVGTMVEQAGPKAIYQLSDARGKVGTARTVFLECTYTWAYAGNTGIQRVVRNIVNQAGVLGQNLACKPIVWDDSGWRLIENLSPDPALATDEGLSAIRLLRWARNLAASLPASVGGVLFESQVKRRLKSAVLRTGKLIGAHRHRAAVQRPRFQRGDVLILLDSGWHVPTWRGVVDAKRQGARIGVMLYDLIPVLTPDLCVLDLVVTFKEWLAQAVRHADFFVCISRAVAMEAERELGALYPELRTRRPAFGVIRLGTDLDLATAASQVRPALRAIFGQPGCPSVYLTVGTIEPRKNHTYLLDAFDSAWARGSMAALCIVGKEGWKCAAVLQRIRTHRQLGHRLFLFHDLNDGEVQHCYQRAHALILPSIVEGFGLPVVEALSLGCRVWASDIPVFREVGGDFCRYFDLRSSEALADLLVKEDSGSSSESTRPLNEFRWPDWQESCAELLRRIDELRGE